MKPTIIFHGNCQSLTFYVMALRDPELRENYTLALMRISDDPEPRRQFEILSSTPATADELLSNCVLFLQQKGLWEMNCGYAERLPPHCRKISFPKLNLELLWPFYMLRPYPRPFGIEENRRGHGDRLFHNLLRQKLPPLETLARFMRMDIRQTLDLDRAYELYFDKLRSLDREVDVPVADFIEAFFRRRPLFVDPAHPFPALCYYVAARLFRCAGILEADLTQNWEGHLNFSPTFPIHPQIIEHYQLTWVDHDTRYGFHAPKPYVTNIYHDGHITKEGDYGYLAGLRKHLGLPDVLPCHGREEAAERIHSLQEELAFWERQPEGPMAKTVATWRAELLTVLGDCHRHLGDAASAKASHQQALALDSLPFPLLPSLVAFLEQEDRLAEAMDLLCRWTDGPNMRYLAMDEKMALATQCTHFCQTLEKRFPDTENPETTALLRQGLKAMDACLQKIQMAAMRQSTPPLEKIGHRLGQAGTSHGQDGRGLLWSYEPFA
ncbi:MAG: hypothetical protein HQL63_16020 [Magnetococcales bacterium]|nr:hypothetical protein [Magnetococcales bacterium]